MPIEAAPIHAVNMKAPCSLNNRTDLPRSVPTTAKFNASLLASLSVWRDTESAVRKIILFS